MIIITVTVEADIRMTFWVEEHITKMSPEQRKQLRIDFKGEPGSAATTSATVPTSPAWGSRRG